MTQQTSFFPLTGGLDLVTPAIVARAGTAVSCLNYEPASNGYKRLAGYERFDGRPAPSDASFWQLSFAFGSAPILAGQIVTGASSGATGRALADAVVTGGSHAGMSAVGHVGLGVVKGAFLDGENLQVAGVAKAVCDGTAEEGESPDDASAARWQAAATANARALIAAIPGSGPVRGVWHYGGAVYGFRDNLAGNAGVMHKAGAAGWAPVTLSKRIDFTGGGTYEIKEGDIVVGETSAASAVVKRVARISGSWSGNSAAGTLIFDGQTGTFAAEQLKVGTNLGAATIAGNSSAVTLPPGGRYSFVNTNFYGSANLSRMYGCNGVGRAFEFDGTTFSPIVSDPSAAIDRPKRIAEHNEALVLALAGGAVSISVVGNPHSFDGTLGAVALGTGDEISDLLTGRGALTILCENSIHNLFGSDHTDYVVQKLSEEAGALAWTAQTVGSPIYMDNRGIRAMSPTQAFGNFNIGLVSSAVEPLIQRLVGGGTLPVASVRQRAKNLYRLFFADNSGLSLYLGKRQPEILTFDLGKPVSCICSIEDGSRQERVFFGSEDGFVYELDRGTSFDGAPVPHFLRLVFNHMGSPQVLKRFHKAIIECEAAPGTALSVSADYDYGDPQSLGTNPIGVTLEGGGGQWDLSNWGAFYWSAPFEGTGEAYLDGVGRNMSLLIAGEAADEPPHLLQGLTLFHSMRGLQR